MPNGQDQTKLHEVINISLKIRECQMQLVQLYSSLEKLIGERGESDEPRPALKPEPKAEPVEPEPLTRAVPSFHSPSMLGSRVLEILGKSRASRREILESTGVSPQSLSSQLAKLMDEKKIRRVKRGIYCKI